MSPFDRPCDFLLVGHCKYLVSVSSYLTLMTLKLMPFESLHAVSYSPSIVTVAVSVAVCEIFSVKEWCDLENRVRVRSRSLEMALLVFDRSHTSSCNYGDFVSFASDLLVKNSEMFIPYL